SQDEPPQANVSKDEGQEGVEVLARGPIHEAYAEPVGLRPDKTSPVVPKQPPDPIQELPPDEKPAGNNVQWIPGYWSWDEDRSDFSWVSGICRTPPPGRQWAPGHGTKVEEGSQWAPGFWAVEKQAEVQYLPPPPDPPRAAASTPAPSDDSVYVP